MRRAQSSFERLVEGWGPFRSDHPENLTGDPTGFRFACGQSSPCAAGLDDRGGKLFLTLDDGHGGVQALPLDRAGPAEFTYRGSEDVSGAWPPSAGGLQVIRTISLDAPGAPEPILVARLWREQPADCAFDSVMQDCR
jgi:hypothetical protein